MIHLSARWACIILFLTPFQTLSWGDAATIIEGHNRQLIADLTAYADLHPDAPDLDRAYARLVDAYADLGRKSEVLTLMEKRYHLNKQRPELPLDQLFGQFVHPVAAAYAEDGKKRDGRRFLLEVRRDFKAHPMYPQIGIILNKMEAKFHGLLPGDPVDFNFRSIKRGEARVSQYKGKWVLIVFWSMRNVGGKFDVPSLKALYKDYEERGLEIIAINEDDRKTDLDKFLLQQVLPWINVHDKHETNQIAETLKIDSTPANILLDQDGNVAKRDLWGDGLRTYLALKVKR